MDADLIRFINQNIDSVELLEILLLAREQSDQSITAVDVAARLRSNPVSTEVRLDDLAARGLVRVVEGTGESRKYQYVIQSAVSDALVARIASEYEMRRSSVIRSIYMGRSSDVRAFAEAFRFAAKPKTEGTDDDC